MSQLDDVAILDSEMRDWDDCQKTIGVSFRRESLLEQAFVHASYCNENPDFTWASNERLEFLGDAVLNFVVTEKLYADFPKLSEGELTEIRASLVCRDTLSKLGSSLSLGEWLLLGRGEQTNGGRTKAGNLSNVMEALLGALFLDQGMTKVRRFILRLLRPQLDKIGAGKTMSNFKALVQELVQGEGRPTPVYRLVGSAGPDHNKKFTVEILVDGEALGRGVGGSKKTAEIQAARAAWETLRCNYGQTRLPTPRAKET